MSAASATAGANIVLQLFRCAKPLSLDFRFIGNTERHKVRNLRSSLNVRVLILSCREKARVNVRIASPDMKQPDLTFCVRRFQRYRKWAAGSRADNFQKSKLSLISVSVPFCFPEWNRAVTPAPAYKIACVSKSHAPKVNEQTNIVIDVYRPEITCINSRSYPSLAFRNASDSSSGIPHTKPRLDGWAAWQKPKLRESWFFQSTA